MAISSDKLLNRPSELHRRYGGRLAMQKAQQEKMVGGGSANIVLTKKSVKNIGIIKTKVIQIESILKGTLAVEKKSLDEKKRKESSQRRERQEEKLETKPNITMGQIKMPSAPRLGIFDWIKNFIGNIVLGYFAVRLIKHLPKIVPIIRFIGQATEFAINIGGKLLDGLATFIDWGYKAYDATRGFIKNIGGENFAKGFDKFVGAIDTALFLTTILATDLAAEAMFGGGGGAPGGRRPRPGQGGRPMVTTSGGGGAGKPDIRSPLRQRPTVTTGQGGKPGGFRLPGTGPEVTASGGGKFKIPSRSSIRAGGIAALVTLIPDIINSGMLASQGRPKDGIRTFLSAIAGVGAAMAAMAGVTAGAAALGITGVGIPAAIALAITGYAASSLAGSAAYNLTDAGLRKLGLVDNDPKTGKPYAYKGGGITRGGKFQGGVKREIGGVKKKGKYKRTLAQKPTETRFKTTDKKVKEVSENLDKTKYFGPVLAVSAKILDNEKPTQKDYENVGLGLNLLIAKGVEEGQLKGGLVAAFAEGGMVDSEFLEAAEKGSNISNWVSRTFQSLIESKVERNLRLIREKAKPAGVPGPGQPGAPDMINIQGGDADFWTLVAIASREDGDPQAWADVAQSIYNRLASGAYSGKTIKDLVLGQMQYEPTWKFPKPGTVGKPNQEWYAIKDAASAGLATGQSEDAMKKVAAALLNPTLQKNARDFIQGRTDFRGYDVSGGVQRKSGDNYFGWYNNYKANKIGSVPNFGATATSTPGGVGPSIGLGAGYGSAGSKIAGELGRFIYQKLKSPQQFQAVTEHPEFGGVHNSAHAQNSYHKYGRAIDIGAWSWEQGPILQAIAQFNNMKGVRPVELLKAGDPGHDNHVHVAYQKGGRANKPTFATLAEDGRPEFVFDADTTAGLDRLAPQLLEKLNMAKTKPQLASILQSYAFYEQSGEVTVIEKPVIVERMIPFGDDSSSAMMFGGGGESDSFDSLYMGG